VKSNQPKLPVEPVDWGSSFLNDARLAKVEFSYKSPGCDRIHHVCEADIKLVLMRLPKETWARLRRVHFNDQSRGGRILGYTSTRGRREISLCALPPRISLTKALTRGQTCEEFGATRGSQWPETAIRRFLIYDVFLHELGHLQVVDPHDPSPRRKFAAELRAEDFATYWRTHLWSEEFPFPDPGHGPPSRNTDSENASRNDPDWGQKMGIFLDWFLKKRESQEQTTPLAINDALG
jgi:hypothetical protein